MSAESAAKLWALLETAPELHPDIAWRIWNDRISITILGYRPHVKRGWSILYQEIEDHCAPDLMVSDAIARIARGLNGWAHR